MHNDASRANRLRAPASVRTTVLYGCNVGQPLCCIVGTSSTCCVGRPAAALVAMVDPVGDAGVADTLEACLADVRKRHEDGEYGSIPWAIAELGIRALWATEHPSRPASLRPVRNEGGVDDEVDGGARVSGSEGTKQRGVIKVDGGVDRIQARLQRSMAAAGISNADIDGRRRSPLRSGGGLVKLISYSLSRL
ncbi:unnamed protein product [Closterium sp. NIES-53]